MATKAVFTAEQYLQTSFDGADREFVNGEVVERNEGEKPHSRVQVRLVEIFYELRRKHALYSAIELRMQLAPARYRIADFAVFYPEDPAELVPSRPPLLVAEIVSREDRYTEILQKLEEYRAWGVRHIWLIDPWRKDLSVYTGNGLSTVERLRLPEFDAEITPDDLFAQI
jgi:Uma2 family endonuclease